MTHAFHPRAAAAACMLAGCAAAQPVVTIDSHVIVPPGRTYGLPAGQTLNVTDTGVLDAAPAVSGSAIRLDGEVLNLGVIRAALGTEVNGLNIGGRTRNGSRIEAVTLQVSGQLENEVSGRVDAGAYPYFPAQGPATPLVGGALPPQVGFGVAEGGTVINHGRWNTWGAADIRGTYRNRGSFESLNNPLTLPAGGPPYTQLLRIGDPFLGRPAGTLRNEAPGTLRLGPQTLLVNEGTLENLGVLRQNGAIVQSGLWGTLHNAAGGDWRLDQGAILRIEPTANLPFVNDGRLEVLRGSVDIQSPFAYTLIGAPGELVVGAQGEFLQRQAGIENAGAIQVDGLLATRDLLNAGGSVTVGAGGRLEVEEMGQRSGHFTVDGSFSGRLQLEGGVLDGQGRINGDVFVGGLGDPVRAPCSDFGLACFRPGNSPGTFTVDGSVSFGEGGVLELEVASDGQGGLWADLLQAGAVHFDAGSTIVVTLAAGLGPIGQDLALLRCAQGCTFAQGVVTELIGGSGVLRFEDGALVLSAVPEPAVWAMLLLGMAVLRRHALRAGEEAGQAGQAGQSVQVAGWPGARAA